MQFNSLIFLLVFLLPALVITLVSGKRIRNSVLLLLSLLFYAWGGVSNLVILLLWTVVNYLFSLQISRFVNTPKARLWLLSASILNILILVFYKYTGFIFYEINNLFSCSVNPPFIVSKAAIPIGLSYFTLSSISYHIDIYRADTKAEKNFIRFFLYIAFFPKVLAGPIVRYKEMMDQLRVRSYTLKDFSTGAERFILGLAKKVLIADSIAIVSDRVFAIPPETLTQMDAWMGVFLYTLQIYVDFSAYSDMAIGLAGMFGFKIPENFNFPYIARSVQAFWQRWHMSLSSWLRDYLFVPLSIRYRNAGKAGVMISAFVTFGICGLWHEPGWNFLVWGLIHAAFISLENLGLSRLLKRIWRPFSHLYLIFVVMFSWVFFRTSSLSGAIHYLKSMFNFYNPAHGLSLIIENPLTLIISAILALTGAAGLPLLLRNRIIMKLDKRPEKVQNIALLSYSVAEPIVLLILLGFSMTYLAADNYSPFIYFRF